MITLQHLPKSIIRQDAMMNDREDWIPGNVGTLGVQRMLRCTDEYVVFRDDLCGRHDIWGWFLYDKRKKCRAYQQTFRICLAVERIDDEYTSAN